MIHKVLLNFFAYIKNVNGKMTIRRIPLNRKLQEKLSDMFIEIESQFIPDEEDKIFDFEDYIHYKPEEDELFVIKDFDMPANITDAISHPIGIDGISEEDYENIKAIFCCEQLSNGIYKIMFTVFDSRKIIKRAKGKAILLYRKNVFTEFEDKMIVIVGKIDVLYSNNNLYFHSFTNAKRIFGELLDEYYREATKEEIKEFSKQLFSSEIPDNFIDSRSKKLIFGIMKSGIPEIQKVVSIGREKFGIKLETNKEGKLEIPKNKRDFKKLLRLLNDDLLESPLTEKKYETNSKRIIKS